MVRKRRKGVGGGYDGRLSRRGMNIFELGS